MKDGTHDLDCPYDWSDVKPDYLDDYPDYIAERVLAKQSNRGKIPTCGASTTGGCTGGTCSDLRLKYDIQPFGVSSSGIPKYTFKYNNHFSATQDMDPDATYVGVMAQDLVVLAPHALCRHSSDGFLRVDYSKIDVDFNLISKS